MNDSFKRFVKWIESKGKGAWLELPAITTYAPNDRVLLELMYQDYPFQIERVSVVPFSRVPLHRHRLVDSCEFHLSGEGWVILGKKQPRLVNDRAPFSPIIVSRNTWHGGYNTKPVTFLSVQYWSERAIGPISSDWEGRDTNAQIESLEELNG